MNRLLAIGFQLAGHWILDDDGLALQMVRHANQTNVLYAFCCDGDVKYVGKTTQSLASRLYGYRKPSPTQSTNQRNHRLICEHLSAGAAVDIFALPDNGLLHYGDFHVNLAAGLEDSIISILKPEWNGSRTTPVEPPCTPVSQTALADFNFTLHKTYFRCGFFNVSVDYESLFAGDGEQIDIFCGDATSPIIGAINRRANLNSTPRIMGGTLLRDWFQSHASILSDMHVTVQTPNEIRVREGG
ncbi:GIY-YIG nuclease family protein [Crateriforma spongiae]|uniref:GIY-YIG nuclease family protein n=1 Tax=Crateriforma spongiae TaxID=2724528 RepID=UPI00197D9194|nr:GIY-YIG nuclease family protein [Crateriforma spongiae]